MGFFSKLFGGGAKEEQIHKMQDGDEPLHELTPGNEMERVLNNCRANTATITDFVNVLLKEKVFVPSPMANEDISAGKPFKPLIMDVSQGRMVPVFTDSGRASTLPNMGIAATSGLLVESTWLLRGCPPELGLYINPGWTLSLILPAESVAQIKKECGL